MGAPNPYPEGLPSQLVVGVRNTTPGAPPEIAIIAKDITYCPFVALPAAPFEDGDYCPELTEANARRLVACWNICVGVPLEELEKAEPGILKEMSEAFKVLHDLLPKERA